jgi:DNA-binding NarL/FixJ family response regulator
VRLHPDICLLDIRMPGNGVAAAWELVARLPETKVVMLTVSDDEDDLLGAIRAGAVGYLLKEIDPRRLPHALYDVYVGKAAMPRALVARVMAEFRDPDSRRRAVAAQMLAGEHLTSREWEILKLLGDGRSTKEIAGRLFISSSAVRVHTGSIVKKLGVQDRAAAVAAFRDGGNRPSA